MDNRPGAPELKGPSRVRERQTKKIEKRKRKEKKRKRKKRKGRTKPFKYPDEGPITLVIITQSLKYKKNNGALGPHVSFSGCMTSKMSYLKFEAHKFERVLWSRI